MKKNIVKDYDSGNIIRVKRCRSKRKSKRENSSFSRKQDRVKIKYLEDKVQSEKTYADRISRMANFAFEGMEQNQKKLKKQLIKKDTELNKFKYEVDAFVDNKLSMQKKIDELKRKGDQFDAIQENLSRIHKKAQLDAQDIIDSAKEQSMDILNIVDDLIYEMEIFKSDIRKIIKDLSIGPATTEDRLNSILYAVRDLEDKLLKVKLDFYKENDIPIY